jgi:hypothetical protein
MTRSNNNFLLSKIKKHLIFIIQFAWFKDFILYSFSVSITSLFSTSNKNFNFQLKSITRDSVINQKKI